MFQQAEYVLGSVLDSRSKCIFLMLLCNLCITLQSLGHHDCKSYNLVITHIYSLTADGGNS